MATDIVIPTTSGVMGGLRSYAFGAVTRLGYNMVQSVVPGGPIVSGAVSAAVAGALIRGPSGDIIPTILGFQALGDMNLLGGFGGFGKSGGGGQSSGLIDL